MRLFEYPLHPWLFAAYPLIAVATSSFGQVAGRPLLLAVVVAWVVVAASVLLTRRLCRGLHGAALLASLLVAVFFSYGHIHGALDTSVRDALEAGEANLPDDSGSRAWHAALTGGALLLLLAAALLVRALPALRSARVSGALNFAAMFLLAATGVQAALAARSPGPPHSMTLHSAAAERHQRPWLQPRLYERHPRWLRGRHPADSTASTIPPYIDARGSAGFAVNDRSSANYYWTSLSLASSAQSRPPALPPAAGKRCRPAGPRTGVSRRTRQPRRAPAARARLPHRAPAFLLGCNLRKPLCRRAAQAATINRSTTMYFRVLAETSWLRLLQGTASEDLAQCHLRRLDLLAQQARRPGPKFVFGALPAAAPPLPVRQRGHGTPPYDGIEPVRLPGQAVGAARCIRGTAAVREPIDAWGHRPPRRPFLPPARDHHPVPITDRISRGGCRWPSNVESGWPISRRSCCPALPPASCRRIPAPVNVFRRVFNHYFGAGFDILPQRSYFSPFRNPYELERVPPEMLAASPGPATVAVPEDP